mmetsp:Transcript_68738/g.136185  ORF Transcript_68738/g.136185 Transcript_68738/m.136185 type:complete len:652 (-) Transcript_68738:406-2361(-)|eukprot:CAMPEP_0174716004 /NCGR_PEP_ID=MMETSP1094-20130205/22730_1 /TAXON_ID=156173 /ORGANISM="Chrysochromulina brevifilum, Strain UTEX LB 985" /LENGTH=651 /DNA_ID=CAMNT_0015915673 /DNA_START=31 /DNA_END=1986 /DNA_ORIENTATION=+
MKAFEVVAFTLLPIATTLRGGVPGETTAPTVPNGAGITFNLEQVAEGDASDWRGLAKQAAELLELECTPELLSATSAMVDAAEGGDSLAMAALGTMYLLGQNCAPKRNLTWGLHWLSRAEELGQADAQAMMGFLHTSDVLRDLYNFSALSANRTHGRILYDRAARGGSTLGSMALGFRHAYGIGVRESCADSAALYEQAAQVAVARLDDRRRLTVEQSNPAETDHLALLAQSMPPRERMDAKAVEYLDYCANIGDPTGKIHMGHLYHAGSHGVPRDRGCAKHWFRAAAHASDGMGHACLGMMKLRERRFRSALRSLRRGTKMRDASAWAGLGYAHLYGAGVPQSDERAAKCLWLAARQGHLDSIYNLGVLTLLGRGVEASVRGGFRLFSVAAEFSHPQAQLIVGRMVRSGLGVRKDCETAQFFLKHAADAGPLVRSLMSTALHAFELGRPQRALMHYLIAAHAGVEAAQHNAAHLYMHEMPKLRADEKQLYQQRAMQYFKLAALQGSTDAQVQLANLLVELKDPTTAANLYREAGRAGSKDALFHLGGLFWSGSGVERSVKTAWALWQSSDFSSKHARLVGVHGALFGVARFVVEFRAFLLFAAGLVAIVSTGGNPMDILSGALGGGSPGQQSPQDWDEEDDDLFASESDE